MDEHEVEISSWAYITHTDDDRPPGGIYTAYERETDALVGYLSYFFLTDDHLQIQFKDVRVEEPYRRRRVATALLRYLNCCHPDARINPGSRNAAGSDFMKHILENEGDKVATNGILNVPLQTMMPPSFRPGDTQLRIWG
jgi:hypothetical protein